MRIDEIELFRTRMPMKAPWKTAFSVEHAIESIFVRIRAEGEEGWGETAPYRLPQFSPEWAAGAFELLKNALAPCLIGETIASGDDISARLKQFKGNYFAKAGLDNAWWDLHARLQDTPLWRLVGGTDPRVEVGADLPVLQDTDALASEIERSVNAGFKRIKLKFRRDCGVEMLIRVRELFPDQVIHIDCNCGFTLEDIDLFKEIDQLDLAMIEQPLAYDDLIDHARLQEQIKTPICLDESITSVARAQKAIDIGACGWINLKPGRVGGLTEAIAIHDLCAIRNVPCWVGGMLESAVGQGSALALATLPNMKYPCDVFPSDRFYLQDVGQPDILLSGPSEVHAPQTPGHGYRPNLSELASCTVEQARLRFN